jgi:hypothetical protein
MDKLMNMGKRITNKSNTNNDYLNENKNEKRRKLK